MTEKFGDATLLNNISSLEAINIRMLVLEIQKFVDGIIYNINTDTNSVSFSAIGSMLEGGLNVYCQELQDKSMISDFNVKRAAANKTVEAAILPIKAAKFIKLEYIISPTSEEPAGEVMESDDGGYKV